MVTSRKVCFKCETEKDRSEFYTHPQMSDGLMGKCKECTKRDVTSNRKKNLNRIREYDRTRYKNQPHRRASVFKKAEENKGRWPEKY